MLSYGGRNLTLFKSVTALLKNFDVENIFILLLFLSVIVAHLAKRVTGVRCSDAEGDHPRICFVRLKKFSDERRLQAVVV